MEKKIAIVLGCIGAIFFLMLITKGKIWPFLIIGVLLYAIYKNNR